MDELKKQLIQLLEITPSNTTPPSTPTPLPSPIRYQIFVTPPPPPPRPPSPIETKKPYKEGPEEYVRSAPKKKVLMKKMSMVTEEEKEKKKKADAVPHDKVVFMDTVHRWYMHDPYDPDLRIFYKEKGYKDTDEDIEGSTLYWVALPSRSRATPDHSDDDSALGHEIPAIGDIVINNMDNNIKWKVVSSSRGGNQRFARGTGRVRMVRLH